MNIDKLEKLCTNKNAILAMSGAEIAINKTNVFTTDDNSTAEHKATAYLKTLPDSTEYLKQQDIQALIPIVRDMESAISDVASAKAMGRSTVIIFKMETVATQKAIAFKNQVQAFKTKYGEYPPKV